MTELPAIIKVLSIFALIVLLNRFKLDLGLSIITGSLLLGLWSGMTFTAALTAMAQSLTEPLTLMILLLVMLILFLNQLMEKNGSSKAMVNHFACLVRNFNVSMVSLPALIGLLPMPGGAYFSAPMVDQLTRDTTLSPSDKTLSNYWFRHLWEFWWPMYPGVIMALSLSGLSLSTYISHQFIYSLFAVFVGWLLLLRRFKAPPAHPHETGHLRPFLKNALPIFIILGALGLLSPLEKVWAVGPLAASGLSKYAPMFFGMSAAIAYLAVKERHSPSALVRICATRKILTLMLLVIAIMAYKKLLTDCGAIGKMNEEFQAYHIPLLPVIILLPFISGLVLAVAMGFVGASFPVVVSLTHGSPDYAAYVSLAYASGYTGMMLSPIHMCLVLTKDYFKGSTWAAIYRSLLPLSLLVFVFGIAVFLLMTR